MEPFELRLVLSPVAANDSYSTFEDTPLIVAASGALANDAGGGTTAVLVSNAAHGRVNLGSNGGFTYTPAQDYNGADRFTYQASNGSLSSNVATVSISIAAVNDGPIALDDFYTTPQGKQLSVSQPGLFGNDTDVDGDYLNWVSGSVTLPKHGTLYTGGAGDFFYTPDPCFSGVDSFTYQTKDRALYWEGINSNTATVTINVTPVYTPPAATNDAYSVQQAGTLQISAPGLLTNDKPACGGLTATQISQPPHGVLVPKVDGSFVYTPDPLFHGNDLFTYQVTDGTNTSSAATVAINVTPLNRPPVAKDDSFSTNENTALTVDGVGSLGKGVVANDYDPDGGTATAQLVDKPAHGQVVLHSDGTLNYTPAYMFFGSDSFTYRLNDGAAFNNLSNVTTVTITVLPVNQSPTAVDDHFAATTGSTLDIAAPGVLGNDSDPDATALTAQLVANANHGMVSLAADGRFTYQPAAGYTGTDSFTYSASDGQATSNMATVNLIVGTTANRAPVGGSDSLIYSSYFYNNGVMVFQPAEVLGNDTDLDGDTLWIAPSSVTQPAPGAGAVQLDPNGRLRYTPPNGYFGNASFTYRVTDGQFVTSPVTVSLFAPTLDPPGAIGSTTDSYTALSNNAFVVSAPGVLANDSFVYGNTAGLSSAPTHGTLSFSPTGGFVYTPNLDFYGVDTFTYFHTFGPWDGPSATVTINVSRTGNHSPVVHDDHFTTFANRAFYGWANLLDTASDPDGDKLATVLVQAPTHGTFTLSSNGRFDYTPYNGFTGTDVFKFQASDGQLLSNVATVTFNVTTDGDRAPVANNDVFTISENASLSIVAPGVLGNDFDADGDPLKAVGNGYPLNYLTLNLKHGVGTIYANGGFTYTPDVNFVGTDSFTYGAYDRQLGGGGTVTINVTPVNQAPTAVNDSFAAAADATLTITAPGVLVNDSDADGDAISTVLGSGPAHGTLALQPSGAFTYTAEAGYKGSDTFSYQASDGKTTSDSVNVSLSIGGMDQPPIANDDRFTVFWNAGYGIPAVIAAPGLLGNDHDPDGDTLSIQLVTGPQFGSLTLGGRGDFVYLPAVNFAGQDSFTYCLSDGRLVSGIATVTLDVSPNGDRGPSPSSDNYYISHDTILQLGAPGVLRNDIYPINNLKSVKLVRGPTHGTVMLQANGALTYIPVAGYIGTDTFMYQETDGQLWAYTPATVTITMYSFEGITTDPPVTINRPPIAHDLSVSVTENHSTLVSDAIQCCMGLWNAASDPDGDMITAALASGPSHGTVTVFRDGSYRYSPSSNYVGSDSFTYTVSDGQFNSVPATVSITVQATNGPVANDDNFSTAENVPLTITGPGLWANDIAPVGDVLTIDGAPLAAHGTISLTSGGGFIYTPTLNFYGTDSAIYHVHDITQGKYSNAATATITVQHVNQPPVTTNDNFSVAPNSALSVAAPGVLTNDSDPDGDPLSAVLASPPSHGTIQFNSDGSFTYTPADGYTGSDSFSYAGNDGKLNSSAAGIVTLAITAVDHAPLATNDVFAAPRNDGVGRPLMAVSPGVLANDSDQDGNTLLAVLVSGTSGGTLALSANGAFTYIPNPNFAGPDSFVYRATDGQLLSPPMTVTIKIVANDQPPIAVNDAVTAYDSGSITLVYLFGALGNNDYDPDGDRLTATILTQPLHGILSVNTNGSYSYAPAGGYLGPDSFTYAVSDGQLAGLTPATVSITVLHANRAPVANNDSGPGYTVAINSSITNDSAGGLGKGVLVNDTDIDSSSSTVIIDQTTTHGALAMNPDGSFAYAPYNNYVGTDSFVYQASDGQSYSNQATVTLTVVSNNAAPTNHAPSGMDTTVVTREDLAYVFKQADFGFQDVNNNPPNVFRAVKISAIPQNGNLTIGSNPVTPGQVISTADIQLGNFQFKPVANAFGTPYPQFIFQVQDDGGVANDGVDTDPTPNTIAIAVSAVNDAPSGAPRTISVAPGALYRFSAADFGFSDPNDTPANTMAGVNITSLTLGDLGTLADNGSVVTAGQFIPMADLNAGMLIFTSTGAANANATFTFQVKDTGGTAAGGVDTDATARTLTLHTIPPIRTGSDGTDETVTLVEDTVYTIRQTDFGFVSYDNPPHSFFAVKITALPASGTLADNGLVVTAGQLVSIVDVSLGHLVFTPAANANGIASSSIRFQVQDDGGTTNGRANIDPSPNTLTFSVLSANDPPRGADTTVSAVATPELVTYTFWLADFGFSDSQDSPANALASIKIVSLPLEGTLSLNGINMLTSGQIVSRSDLINRKFVYSVANFAGPTAFAYQDKFTFQVQDDGGTANGGLDLDPTRRSTTINVPPYIASWIQIPEDFVWTFTLGNFIAGNASGTADQITRVNFKNRPAFGTLKVNGVVLEPGSFVPASVIRAGGLTYTPNANANDLLLDILAVQPEGIGGPDIWGFAFDVRPVNDPPSATDKTISILYGIPYALQMADFGFSDPSDNPPNNLLAVKITTLPAAGLLTDAGVPVVAGQCVPIRDLANGALQYVQPANMVSPDSFTFQVQDDGGTIRGGIDLSAIPQKISLVPPPPLPGIGKDTADATLEDTALAFSPLDFALLDAGIIPAPALVAIKINSLPASGVLTDNGIPVVLGQSVVASDITAGLLRYVPPADVNGVASGSFTFYTTAVFGNRPAGLNPLAIDGDSHTLTIDITPVNDVPRFTKGADLNATDASGEQIIHGWATGISPGAPNEVNQRVHFVILSDSNVPLFASSPAIDSAGNVTFTPALNAQGIAEITIALADDGGTANGGVDTSQPWKFTIGVSLAKPLHNRQIATDVTGDGNVIAEDVIDVINFINAFGSGPVAPTKPGTPRATLLYDVTGDDYVAADDVVAIINYINAHLTSQQKTGELAQKSTIGPTDNDVLLTLLAFDIASEPKRRIM